MHMHFWIPLLFPLRPVSSLTDKAVITVISDRNPLMEETGLTWPPMVEQMSTVTENFLSSSIHPDVITATLTRLQSLPVNQTECVGETYSSVGSVIIWIVLVLIAFATAGGNFLVILAVILVRKLQTPSNILIVSLAFSDFLVGILVLPFTILDVLKGYWPFNEGLCDMYISFDVLLCTASILNLCAISIDRYLTITRPLTYVSKRTPFRMAQMIAAAWILSALISIPPNFGWKPPFEDCKCEYSKNAGYQIYATISAFFAPLLVMIVLYGRIFRLARQMARTEQRQMVPQQTDENRGQHDQNDYSQPSGTNGSSIVRRRSSLPDTEEEHHMVLTNENTQDQVKGMKRGSKSVLLRGNGNRSMSAAERRRHLRNRPVTFSDGSVTAQSSQHRSSTVELTHRKSKNNSDSKVIKTLGVIMGCFCLCWLPFFMVQLTLAILNACGVNIETVIPLSAFRFLQWLGYINSFLNPLIYAKFNREFRLPFKLILLFKCRGINARLRSAAFSAQYGLPNAEKCRVGSASSRVDRRSRLETMHASIGTFDSQDPTGRPISSTQLPKSPTSPK